jgi:hypothetical protein
VCWCGGVWVGWCGGGSGGGGGGGGALVPCFNQSRREESRLVKV